MKRLVITCAAIIFIMCSGTLWAENESLDKSARNLESEVMGLLKGIERTLSKSAITIGKLGPNSLEINKVLKECRQGRSYVIDSTFVDDKGMMKFIEPEIYKKLEGTDISSQDVVKEILKTKQPVMSNIIESVEGIKSVVFEVPVFSPKKEFIGFLSILTKIEEMIKFAAVQIEAGRGVKTWVMQKDGLIIYETDHRQIGLNLFTDPLYQNYPELLELGKRMVKEPSGQGMYTFLLHGKKDVVRKEASWRTLNFYGRDWIVVVYQQSN